MDAADLRKENLIRDTLNVCVASASLTAECREVTWHYGIQLFRLRSTYATFLLRRYSRALEKKFLEVMGDMCREGKS